MKVDFFMCQEFLRSDRNTNPYFDPIIRVCEDNGIAWRVCFRDPPSPCGYPKGKWKVYSRLYHASEMFYRIVHLFWHVPVWRIYRLYGKIARWFVGDKFDADLVITCGGVEGYTFMGLLPNARVIDLQHGVVYSTHSGYFDKRGEVWRWIKEAPNREFWLYGQGYADCFFKNAENRKWLDGRVKVIGDVVRAGERVEKVEGVEKRNLVVIASQMTTDFDAKTLAGMKAIYERFMDKLKGAEGVRVVFRHHPRFGGAIDLGDWTARYDWVDFNDKRPWDEVYAEALCVATINSTCAFDAAAQGVPTVLLDGASLGWSNLMVEEYNYPLKDLGVRELLAMSEKDMAAIHSNLAKWYNTYYTPFSPERCLKLLKGEI